MTALFFMVLRASAALAGELTEVTVVPAGSTVTDAKGKVVVTVPATAFLLPEDYYDRALVKAKQLEVYRPAYEACMADMEHAATGVRTALDLCIRLQEEDDRLATNLYERLRAQEAQYIAERDKVLVLRSQRNTAWAVAGSLVLGAVVTTAVVLN
jgi:hypothetical protein